MKGLFELLGSIVTSTKMKMLSMLAISTLWCLLPELPSTLILYGELSPLASLMVEMFMGKFSLLYTFS